MSVQFEQSNMSQYSSDPFNALLDTISYILDTDLVFILLEGRWRLLLRTQKGTGEPFKMAKVWLLRNVSTTRRYFETTK